MSQVINNPFYSESDYKVNQLDYQLQYLIRTVEDAKRIVACIYPYAKYKKLEGVLTETLIELDSILAGWNEQDFPSRALQAEDLLCRLDNMFTEAVDYFPELELIRMLLYPLQFVIHKWCQVSP